MPKDTPSPDGNPAREECPECGPNPAGLPNGGRNYNPNACPECGVGYDRVDRRKHTIGHWGGKAPDHNVPSQRMAYHRYMLLSRGVVA